MDSPVVALARRSPFVRRAMDRIANRCGQSIAFIVVAPNTELPEGMEWEPDMVLAAFNTPGKEPIAIIHGAFNTIEWVPELAPPDA